MLSLEIFCITIDEFMTLVQSKDIVFEMPGQHVRYGIWQPLSNGIPSQCTT